MATAGGERAGRGLLVGATLALFLVWSHTFLAFEVLLAPREGPAPLRWHGLVLARFLPVAALAGAWLLLFRRKEAAAAARAHPRRLLACSLLAVPVYNGILYYGMEARLDGPLASLLTSLAPLYVLLLGAAFLGERPAARQWGGLLLGLGGVGLLATGREARGASPTWTVLLVALSPLCWAAHTVLTKPVVARHRPEVWTLLVLAGGGLLLLPAAAATGLPDPAALDGRALALLAFLVLLATLGGFVVWSWLLRHLPAGTVGLTVFLNPPLTAASKALLSVLFPATFAFSHAPREWAGAGLALAGVALALSRPRERESAGMGRVRP
jgi:drug/metabolite transporter (DMT)-like permease